MGGDNSKLGYRNAVIQLTTKTQPVDSNDDNFWDQFWAEYPMSIQDIFALIPAAEIRALRTEAPNNLATLCYKAIERIAQVSESASPTTKDQLTVLNCIRLLTRLLPYIFEDTEWRSFFWSPLPVDPSVSREQVEFVPLAQSLLSALCDLLFCPDFTVHSIPKSGPESPEDMHTIDSCEYIWQSGVGFAQAPAVNAIHDSNRTEILKLILTCFSETMYLEQEEAHRSENRWVKFFTSTVNRHALPLFASLLNVVCAYDPVGLGVPYNHLMFSDSREPLVEVALQILCITLEPDHMIPSPTYSNASFRDLNSSHSHSCSDVDEQLSLNGTGMTSRNSGNGDAWNSEMNLFVNYMSRIHRDEVSFILIPFSSNILFSHLPFFTFSIFFHTHLSMISFGTIFSTLNYSHLYIILIFFVIHLILLIWYGTRIGLIHVGVFILLLLSGERNFGVRLNKPYRHRSLLDVPVFTGTHADLLIIVSHRLITSGHNRLNPLFDCLLTIIANVSPYLKSLSMVSSNKILHLLDAFSQPWFLYSNPSNHQLVFLLLEVFNNIIQYQFDGNSNLVYTIIRKRQIFYRLANLPTDQPTINSIINKQMKFQCSGHITMESTTTVPTSTSSRASSNSGGIKKSVDTSVCKPLPISEISKSSSTSTCLSGESSVYHNNDNDNVDSSNVDNSSLVESMDQVSSRLSELKVVGKPSDSIQASLADVPPLHKMTGKRLGNATQLDERFSNYHAEIENNLISHSSPSQRTPVDSTTTNNNDESDRDLTIHNVQEYPINRSGISESSLTSTNQTKETQNSSLLTSDTQSFHSIETITCKQSNSSHSMNDNNDKLQKLNEINSSTWEPTSEWVHSWKLKMPFQTIMRLLQVLVPQVEKICIDKGLTDETEIVRFLQNGTLVGLLPVPHPILIRKYQSNTGTTIWFRNYLWGIIYLRNITPPIWYETNVRLFEIQRI
ncbi:hypothetical protein Smp_050890 [Schistosoma mansoni]|uniref:hypothetical protein n=1 Tax=Schistosoma mansoni TaxID=6183 RepID=UPI0001A63F0B|nr:hypothetical protein Smp_050890 [Schistosoma mansoni]|eukprot:XP_018653293.1 hypothetical protein Smp_050890 [Schistosoma mansoni]